MGFLRQFRTNWTPAGMLVSSIRMNALLVAWLQPNQRYSGSSLLVVMLANQSVSSFLRSVEYCQVRPRMVQRRTVLGVAKLRLMASLSAEQRL